MNIGHTYRINLAGWRHYHFFAMKISKHITPSSYPSASLENLMFKTETTTFAQNFMHFRFFGAESSFIECKIQLIVLSNNEDIRSTGAARFQVNRMHTVDYTVTILPIYITICLYYELSVLWGNIPFFTHFPYSLA